MTLRLRLSLWYGTLCALALCVVGLAGYSASVREQYLTVDRVLVVSAQLVEAGILANGRSYALETDTTKPTKDGIVMVLRSYTPAGELMYISPSDPGLPPASPVRPLLTPAPPAYLRVLPAPLPALLGRGGVEARPNSAFGTLDVEGQRWRRYVVQVGGPRGVIAYVEALTPLGALDSASLRLARLLLQLAAGSVVAVVVVGWLLAGSALRPVSRLMRAAREITHSRDLKRRVQTRGSGDELDRLATTFNGMLDSLEAAWTSQQRFVGDASHELRAPLTVMRGNLELLRRHHGLPEAERAEMLSDIDREATRLSRLVEDLLLLAQSDAGVALHRRPVDLHALAAEAARDTRRLSPGHVVTLCAPDGPLTVPADPERLKQLLLILLDNATKYSPPGTTVTLTLAPEPGSVLVTVADAGPGIAPSALPHLFERFFRADAARTPGVGGAGLGLAIAQWIAEHLGGRVWVEHTGPGGTTFAVRLPLEEAPAPAPSEAAVSPASLPGSRHLG